MACGTLYVYSAYAPQISDRLEFSATQMSRIGMAGNLSMSLSGPLAGYVVDSSGSWLPLVLSLVCNVCGYTVMRMAYVNQKKSPLLLMSCLVLIGLSSSFAFLATVKYAAVNFTARRGFATSVAMAGYGLSAFVISALATKLVPGNTEGYLSLLTFFPSLLLVFFGPVIALTGQKPSKAYSPEFRKQHRDVVELQQLDAADHVPPVPVGHDDDYVGLVTADGLVKARESICGDLHGTALLNCSVFWCYTLILGFLAGMGQTYIYSCGYMVKALAVHENERTYQSLQVAILSLANCTGRLLSGVASDAAKNRLRLSRTYVLAIAIALCCAGQLMARFLTSLKLLSVLSILNGLFYGFCYGTFPGVISDAFGLSHFSSNWGIVAMAPVPVSYVLTLRMAKLYDHHSSSGVCVGPRCFQHAFTLTTMLAFALFGVLVFATRQEQRK